MRLPRKLVGKRLTFKRRPVMKGQGNAEWLDPTLTYRVSWVWAAHEIALTPHAYATVAVHRKNFTQWDFAGPRRPYKTLAAAVRACEDHERLSLLLPGDKQQAAPLRRSRLPRAARAARLPIAKENHGS